MIESPARSAASAGEAPRTGLERLAGGLLVIVATAEVAVLESFYVLLRVGTVRLPVSVGVAVVCHPLLTWLMRAATGSPLSMLAPFVVWLAVVLPLGLRRADGDLIVTGNNWVATALLYGGSLLFVGSIGLLLPARPRAQLGSAGR